MSVFSAPEFDEHEQVLFVNEPEFGLEGHHRHSQHHAGHRPWVAAGCGPMPASRRPYAMYSGYSRGMTYKAACTRLRAGWR